VNKLRDADPAAALLERLLVLSERRPDRTHPASAVPNYDELLTADSIARFEAQLQTAANVGAVQVERGKRDRRHLVDRVRVLDAAALARHLGRVTSKKAAEMGREALLSAAEAGAPWVMSVLDRMVERWRRGESAHRLSAADTDEAREFITLLSSISNDRARGLDGRTFSIKATGDSKSFDRHSSRIAAVVAAVLGDEKLSADEVWARLNLERFGHPVHLRGPLSVRDHGALLVDCGARPFASPHPDVVSLLEWQRQPSAVLTVENYSSFNRQVREIEDDTLVVYLGGFPSASVVRVLTWILGSLDASVPFLHWGDIDPGGIRIFRFLEETFPRTPMPHLMNRSIAEACGRPAKADPTLKGIGQSSSAIAPLALWLAEGEHVRHLEQEVVDPRAVSLSNPMQAQEWAAGFAREARDDG
jgi:Uncharacterized protein conserved in bacteria C-term(DUF2220)/Uncharacterized protein conserved in bacteria N-term (DUF3322)